MGRPNRVHFKGAVYHAMSQGNDGCDIFLDDEDRLVFLGILESVCRKAGGTVYALSLMFNHFHLLIEVAAVSLSAIMQRLLSRYSRYFNTRHGRKGHLFRSRYKGNLCHDENYLLTALRYIHLNPVKDGLVEDPADWPWSSHKQYIGPIRSTLVAVESMLARLGGDKPEAVKAYEALIARKEDPRDAEFAAVPWPDEEAGPCASSVTLEAVSEKVFGKSSAMRNSELSGRRSRALTSLRREFAQSASAAGHSSAEIARFLGVHPTAVSQYLALPH